MNGHGWQFSRVCLYQNGQTLMKKIVLAVGFCFGLCRTAFAADTLADLPEWLALGHYQKGWFGYEGTIGSDNFYVSPEGKNNPLKELEATVTLFQSDDVEKKCLFPARYMFLKKHGLVSTPFPSCAEFEQFKEDLQPAGMTLLFTDAYMNNSSSLFGHTLLRVDTARKGTQLLAHGINYGAWTQGYENSFLYAVYGLAGFYPGGYTVKPYYDIINTYNNIENRDIWEYNLNLTSEELDLFVAHIWEVGQTTTPYYFFTQNCSYMLMELFDAVRPELNLAAGFKGQTIPLDTIKAVNAREGLVKSVNYRPSRQRKIRYRIKQMNERQYDAFLDAITLDLTETQNLPEDEKADVLETAYQYVQYQYVAGDLALKDYRQKSFQLLRARNQAAAGQKFDELKEGQNPVLSHDSMMVSLGVGVQNGDVFEQLSFRPAYHLVTDRGYGFLSGAEIDFLDVSFRHYDKHDKYVLDKLNVLQLSSFSPINAVFQAMSYRIGLDVSRQINPKSEDEGYVLNGNVGGGGTVALSDHFWFYGLSSVEAAYGGFLPNNQWLGAGLAAGMIVSFEKAALQAEVKKVFATDKIGSALKWHLTADYYFSRNQALETIFTYTQNYGKNQNEVLVRLKQYF